MFLKWLVCFILVNSKSTNCDNLRTEEESSLLKLTPNQASEVVLSSAKECLRECKKGAPAKICYYHFTLELYPVLGKACQHCTPNYTNAIESNCQCITANGVERTMLSVNRMLPGPSIHVCLGDKIVVDVKNMMPGIETSIHWHGVFQNGTPYYDGVPLLTQCPIAHGQTFRYQFPANNEGTHLWHAHTGFQRLDGLYGSLIVHIPRSKDPNGHLYDYDLSQHVILISDWRNTQATERFPGTLNISKGQEPESILINGKGQYRDKKTGNVTTSPSEIFEVTQGRRYRFRIINSYSTTCPTELKIQGHTMTVIAADGVPVQPRTVNTILCTSGERFDFVLNAHQPAAVYWIQVRGVAKCVADKIQQTAILRYKEIRRKPSSAEPTYERGLPVGVVLNSTDGSCSTVRSDDLCVSDLKSASPVDEGITRTNPDIKLYIPFNFILYKDKNLYQPNTYNPFIVVNADVDVVATVDNITFVFPSSPPLSQINDIPPNTFCNASNPPTNCGTTCMCTNTYDIPLNSIVELIIIDEGGAYDLKHPFHLHGYAFNVMRTGNASDFNLEKISAKDVRNRDSKHPIERNFQLPPFKDTIPIPSNGYAIIRFRADNPGYWLFHCHFLYHENIGMQILFHVGESSDLPSIPQNFPACSNYVPPITPIK